MLAAGKQEKRLFYITWTKKIKQDKVYVISKYTELNQQLQNSGEKLDLLSFLIAPNVLILTF